MYVYGVYLIQAARRRGHTYTIMGWGGRGRVYRGGSGGELEGEGRLRGKEWGYYERDGRIDFDFGLEGISYMIKISEPKYSFSNALGLKGMV